MSDSVLVKMITDLAEQMIVLEDKLKDTEAENTNLREYAKHADRCCCRLVITLSSSRDCDCGFDALLAEPAKTPSSEEEK